MPGADLALTSSTIADAREVFEIVIEIQLVVLYAMKIYCKHINERDIPTLPVPEIKALSLIKLHTSGGRRNM